MAKAIMKQLVADSFRWLQTAFLEPCNDRSYTCSRKRPDIEYKLVELPYPWYIATVSNDLCRGCKMLPETIEHIVTGCPSMAQSILSGSP